MLRLKSVLLAVLATTFSTLSAQPKITTELVCITTTNNLGFLGVLLRAPDYRGIHIGGIAKTPITFPWPNQPKNVLPPIRIARTITHDYTWDQNAKPNPKLVKTPAPMNQIRLLQKIPATIELANGRKVKGDLYLVVADEIVFNEANTQTICSISARDITEIDIGREKTIVFDTDLQQLIFAQSMRKPITVPKPPIFELMNPATQPKPPKIEPKALNKETRPVVGEPLTPDGEMREKPTARPIHLPGYEPLPPEKIEYAPRVNEGDVLEDTTFPIFWVALILLAITGLVEYSQFLKWSALDHQEIK